MKNFFTFLLLLFGLTVMAQQYNNEWINFNQTYYKFKVGSAGLYRIPKAVLDGAGIGSANVQNFELWRNGQQVPFYPSVSSGTLPAGGYIEFWGEPNDGKPDKAMYRSPSNQHTDKLSLITDTASYFLSVNTSGTGVRVTDQPNNVASNTLPAEPYFMYTKGNYFRNQINPGKGVYAGEYLYSSSYDIGEFFSSQNIKPASPLTAVSNNLHEYTGGPSSTLSFGATGDLLNERSFTVKINNTLVKDTVMNFFNDINTEIPFATTLLTGGTATVEVRNNSSVSSDIMVVSYYAINYPRLFNFDNQTNFQFSLPAKAAGYYLEITNFNTGAVAPVLYDLTAGARYTGDISSPGLIKFAIGGTAETHVFVLVSEDASAVKTVTSLTTKNFIRFDNSVNQGDYLIITNPLLYNGTHGNNPIVDYKNYRESNDGGKYHVLIVEIDELVDQFAFGIKKHPLSVKNFLRYARAKFAETPKFVFLIGRGMSYNEYRLNESDPTSDKLNLIPTFGYPASDNMLSSESSSTSIAITPIGRLAVISAKELEDYTEKIVDYESVQKNSPNTIEGRGWMKNVVHVSGGGDASLGNLLCSYMTVYKAIIEDTLFGGTVSSFCKTSTNNVEQLSSNRIESLFHEGISILTYFGHSGSTTLEFNLNNPEAYDNTGKYPIFFVCGCNAGNFFTFTPSRLSATETLSEKFVLAKRKGTIGFVASTHLSLVNYLNIYLDDLYQAIGRKSYGKSLGEINRDALLEIVNALGPDDMWARLHAEEITVHGDPALRTNAQLKPDLVIEESQIFFNPAFISVAENDFKLKIKVFNIGRSTSDSVSLVVTRRYPKGTSEVVNRLKIPPVKYADSVEFRLPIISTRDKGSSRITVTVDDNNAIDEVSENNNTASKDFFIFEDEARPVYPYEYSIIPNNTQKLYASTADPLSVAKEYKMELDTTALFNSSMKVSRAVTSTGGVIEFDPGVTYLDSTVYFWRVAKTPQANEDYHWNLSSFMYKSGGIEGFNQSSYFQHTGSELKGITLDSASRAWSFGFHPNNIFARNGVFPTAANVAEDFEISVNGNSQILSVCGISGIIFNVFDPVTMRPWFNSAPGGSQYGSDVVCGNNRRYNFQFNILDSVKRKKAVEFMDLIPPGAFVVVKNITGTDPATNTYAADWQKDTSFLGSNNSLYHRLLEQGFTKVDSFNHPVAWIFTYRKNDTKTYAPKSVFSQGIYDRISLSADAYTPDTVGYINSPVFGPAKEWKQVIWSGAASETPTSDNAVIDVIGLDSLKQETKLFTLDQNTQNLDISSVNAKDYPYLQLRMTNIDTVKLTPYQLHYWRVYYEPVAEGAIAPNLYLVSKDTFDIGESLKFAVAFKNVSRKNFDSLLAKVTIVDKNNVSHNITLPRIKPLIVGDTAIVQLNLDTKDYIGNNTMFLEFNPDNDQPEQYHFNNFLFHTFFVHGDNANPLLDVTFDGVHILNRDIVSSKPHIQIKLKDDAKYLLLNDTALTTVQLRYPDGTLHAYSFDNDTLRFNPAVTGSDNTATIDFYPQFLKQFNPEGDEYELIVSGKDRSGNKSPAEFRVSFKVITKPMISNMLNYPNPFTTSTAFVFTVTGSEVPQNIKIQILTITGKIVREITKQELGPIHIGRNITEFKWDGTDQYGQRLANGVYLYRFVTTLNGKRMDKYTAEGDNTDQYFNNGYGKMYLMK
jgi:hypothetical protein